LAEVEANLVQAMESLGKKLYGVDGYTLQLSAVLRGQRASQPSLLAREFVMRVNRNNIYRFSSYHLGKEE
jgi:hypothetical protein